MHLSIYKLLKKKKKMMPAVGRLLGLKFKNKLVGQFQKDSALAPNPT